MDQGVRAWSESSEDVTLHDSEAELSDIAGWHGDGAVCGPSGVGAMQTRVETTSGQGLGASNQHQQIPARLESSRRFLQAGLQHLVQPVESSSKQQQQEHQQQRQQHQQQQQQQLEQQKDRRLQEQEQEHGLKQQQKQQQQQQQHPQQQQQKRMQMLKQGHEQQQQQQYQLPQQLQQQEHQNGPPPVGMAEVSQRCHHTWCLAPQHIKWDSHKGNMDGSMKKGMKRKHSK